jgi:hypothetical protein
MADRRYLTVGEVAEILDVSTQTVRNMIAAHELPAQRASSAKKAAWMIDAEEFERQRAADVERAAIRQRLVGVVTGSGEEFVEKLAQRYPDVTVGSPDGPSLAEYVRTRSAELDLFERLQSEMRADPDVQSRLRELDEADRIEAEAQELARLYRRDRAVHDRFREIIEED